MTLLAGYYFNWAAHEPWLVAGLMSLPVVAQLIGLVFIYWRRHIKSFSTYYAFMMSACVFSTYALWIAFNLNYHSRKWSLLSLIAIGVITSFVLVMTIAIMRVETGRPRTAEPVKNGLMRFMVMCITWASPKLGNLKHDVGKEPFLALLLFFSAFLCISYLFGLAFAFYDKTLPQGGKPALYMRNLYPDEDVGSSKQEPGTTANGENTLLYAIHFKTARAIPEIENCDLSKVMPSILRQKGQKANEMWEAVNRRNQNFKTLGDVVADIKKHTENNGRIRIVLIGRADDTSTKGTPYSSNYELSQARAQNVEMKLLERLVMDDATGAAKPPLEKWLNIEWVILPLSNEPAVKPIEDLISAGNPSDAMTLSTADNRVVDIRIEGVDHELGTLQMRRLQSEANTKQYKLLDLMDYIYFANYTITTTGYGDIMPTTSYSKFLCSLANIFEVFFLVVFFNTLLSLRKDDADTVHAQSADKVVAEDVREGHTNNVGSVRRFLEHFGMGAQPKQKR
jgi:hypothetical protein